MKLTTQFIALNDGTEICAPDDVTLMTNFVLREQGDWFEDEIKFVREYIQPEMKVLDIGANYGLYSTAIAKKLDGDGHLWCFEPTPNTAKALRATLKKNSYEPVVDVIEAGLSDHNGQATFFMSPNAELNSLSAEASSKTEEQIIELLTLDHCMKEFKWPAIDFIKLDAEGEELKILEGGTEFFKTNAPLVMFELKHLENVNLPLIDAFRKLDFEPYFLIPGLNVLAPFNRNDSLDGYLLNLFCAKKETIAGLKEKGVIVEVFEDSSVENSTAAATDLVTRLSEMAAFDSASLEHLKGTDLSTEYGQALSAYVCSMDETLPKQQRFNYLSYCLRFVKDATAQGESKAERLSTYARIAFDAGFRQIGVQILQYVIKRYMQDANGLSITEYFVSAGKEFDKVSPATSLEGWLCASVLDQYVRKMAHSCYFNGPKTMPIFNNLRSLELLTPEMALREKIVLERVAAVASSNS